MGHMAQDIHQLWDRFASKVIARLESGQEEYGDVSLTLPTERLVDEIQQELEDVAGWGLILWTRLQRCRKATARIDREASDELVALRAAADAARACLTVVVTNPDDEYLMDRLSARLLDVEMVKHEAKQKPKAKSKSKESQQ
jgi:hypothetical protein